MPTQIDWCNRCAAAVLDEDGHEGACGCAEGQLKQLLAHSQPARAVRQAVPTPRRPAPSVRTPVLAHLKADHVVNPFATQAAAPRAASCNCRSRPCACRRMTAAVPQQEQDFSQFYTRTANAPAASLPVSTLESLWSTEPTDEDFTAGPARTAAEPQLEALWMGRVAQETGMDAPDLSSLWMSEIATPQGTTASSSSNEITFDNDLDAEIATYPQGGRSAAAFSVMAPPPRSSVNGPRVQVGQVGRFAVMAESETFMTRTAAREQAFDQGRSQMGPPLPMVVPRSYSVQNFRDVREQRAAATVQPQPRTTSALQRAGEYSSRPTAYQRLMSDD